VTDEPDRDARELSDLSASERAPGTFASLVPLVVTLAALNALPRCMQGLGGILAEMAGDAEVWWSDAGHVLRRFPEDPTLAIFLGVLTGLVVLRRHVVDISRSLGEGFVNGLVAIGSTCSVVGFGHALEDLAAFKQVVAWVTRIPGDPLIGAALAVAAIAGIAGSASGGQGLALPIIKPIYIDELGVAPRALHRVVSIASGSLDTLPANGYLVMLIRNICGETHARAYWPICVTTAVIPLAGTVLAIGLFKLVPSWGSM
jgi:H+/gluconate symporter-like permease